MVHCLLTRIYRLTYTFLYLLQREYEELLRNKILDECEDGLKVCFRFYFIYEDIITGSGFLFTSLSFLCVETICFKKYLVVLLTLMFETFTALLQKSYRSLAGLTVIIRKTMAI